MKRKILVCRVEYETKDRTNWKANVLAYDMQHAINYLQKRIANWDRYISTQIVGEINAVEERVYDDHFVSKETKIVETVVSEDVGEKLPSCPWCDKEFKSTQTLGTHIRKFHLD